MKKVLIILLLLFLPFLFIASMIGAAYQQMFAATPVSNKSVCEYEGNAETHDSELENMRESVQNRLSNKSLTNAVLGIYKVEKPADIADIIAKMNEFHEYDVKHNRKLTGYEYIQAYKYGTTFLDWLESQNANVSLSINKRYMKEVLNTNNNDYAFYVRVMSHINDNCVTITDGLPLKKPYTITGWFPNYGKDGSGDKHNGIDIGVPIGTPVYAIADGEVIRTWNKCNPDGGKIGNMCGSRGTGNYVLYKIKQENKVYYIYAMHLEKAEVNAGDTLIKGQRIGTSGNSGNSTGPHLHTEIRDTAESGYTDKNIINPCKFIEDLCTEKEVNKDV